jgi:abortive infection bacteriophage resistance protein
MDGNIQISGNVDLLKKETFAKPPLSIDNHISLMKDRGLEIQDEDNAKQILASNSYYRLL